MHLEVNGTLTDLHVARIKVLAEDGQPLRVRLDVDVRRLSFDEENRIVKLVTGGP